MRKVMVVAVLFGVAVGANAGMPKKPKFNNVGHTFQGDQVCVRVDERRKLDYCATPQKIQKCMDAGNGTCNAQLIDAGEGSSPAKIEVCSPVKQNGWKVCDANEYKQYQFRYTEKGASNAVLY